MGVEKAKAEFQKFRDFEAEVPDGILFEAMKFRLAHKKKGFSYADAIMSYAEGISTSFDSTAPFPYLYATILLASIVF